jgi:hydroxypyruvate isomerase
MRTFVKNLTKAADLCAPLGVTLLIETNNLRDNPNYLLRTLAEAREIIDLVERSNLKVIFDFYHVQINEGDVTRRFLEFLDLIDHIQFANPPGRNEPGVGELDFHHIFHLIDSSGYAAWVGAEYFPSRDTQQSLGWLRDHAYLR